jgi:hypothetical protein
MKQQEEQNLYTNSKAFEATPENSETKRGNKETYGKVTQFLLILEDAVKDLPSTIQRAKNTTSLLYATAVEAERENWMKRAASCIQLEQNQ